MDDTSYDMTTVDYSGYSQPSATISPVFWLIYFAVIILFVISMWRIFTKAGKPGWAALIPFYNMYVMLQIVGRPAWWLILYFIPFANIVAQIMVTIDLAKSFKKIYLTK